MVLHSWEEAIRMDERQEKDVYTRYDRRADDDGYLSSCMYPKTMEESHHQHRTDE